MAALFVYVGPIVQKKIPNPNKTPTKITKTKPLPNFRYTQKQNKKNL